MIETGTSSTSAQPPASTSATTAARVRVAAATDRLLDLADAARAIAGASTVEDLLRVVTEAARSMVGTHQAVTSRLRDGWRDAETYVSLSDKYADFRGYAVVPRGLGVLNYVTRENKPLRLSADELRQHPEWRALADAPGHPPLPDYLAAPLISRDGRNIGLIQLADKADGTWFSEEDEATLVQLALMVSSAIEHVELAVQLERTLASLGLVLDATSTGTRELDLRSGRVKWSATLERIFGWAPGEFPGTREAYLAAVHPEDRAAAIATVEDARRTNSAFSFHYRIVRPSGELRWVEGAGLPVTEADGSTTTVAGVCVDVTDRQEAEQRLRRRHQTAQVLQRVGQTVTANLDLDEVVQTVTDAATALTGAAFGAFFYNVVADTGESYQLYALSGVPTAAFSDFPMPRNTAVFAPTFAGEAPLRLADVTADPRYGRNPPYFGMPEGHLPVRSYLGVPVVLSNGEVAGGLFFGHPEPGRFGEDEERATLGIAGYAAIAIENSRLYQTARRVADALQRPLQPPPLPDVPGMELAADYRPYGGDLGVGGDFYDVFETSDGRWVAVLGDVCGKGPEAAALAGLARSTLWAVAETTDDPHRILGVLNRALHRSGDERFCTAVLVLLDPLQSSTGGARLTVACAGHPPPLLVPAGGGVVPVGRPGMALGLFADADVETAEVLVPEGAALFLYTDGLVEGGGRRGIDDDDLRTIVAAADRSSAQRLVEGVVAEVSARQPARDDSAVLVLRGLPAL